MKTVSIIIPCKNEQNFIKNCIKSVIAFEIPEGLNLEIFVVDGLSDDQTVSIVDKIIEQYPNTKIQLVVNQKIYASYAMNEALKLANGDYILRLDAHAVYPENYLKECYQTSIRTCADNVGGLVKTLPGSDKFEGKLVQALTTHKFGVGNSGFRVGMEEGNADTVPYGFFNRQLFNKIGYFDQRLVRAQDFEFNSRIHYFKGKVWLNPKIQVTYFNQPDLASFYKKQFYKEAPYNAYMWKVALYYFTIRHGITSVFTLGIFWGSIFSFFSLYIKNAFLAVLVLYLTLAIISSLSALTSFKEIWFILILPICFFLFHFIHGLGLLIGLLKLAFKVSPVQKNEKPWDQARSINTIEAVKLMNA